MKSLFSWLAALVVLAALAAGGYWVYQKVSSGQSPWGKFLPVAATNPALTLENGTHYVLTVTLRGPGLERFQLGPGKAEKRTLKPGTYQVEGSISDPDTSAFTGEWTFESGGNYTAGFKRDGGQGMHILVPVRPAQQASPPASGKAKPGSRQ